MNKRLLQSIKKSRLSEEELEYFYFSRNIKIQKVSNGVIFSQYKVTIFKLVSGIVAYNCNIITTDRFHLLLKYLNNNKISFDYTIPVNF